MVVHYRGVDKWWFRCWSCKRELPRTWIVHLEGKLFDRIGGGVGGGRESTADAPGGSAGHNPAGKPLQIVADCNGEPVGSGD